MQTDGPDQEGGGKPGGGLAVSDAIDLMLQFRGSEFDVIVDRLVAHGASRPRALWMVNVIPLAFGRVMVRSKLRLKPKFKDTVRLMGPFRPSPSAPQGYAEREIHLDQERIYLEAARLAEEAVARGTMAPDDFAAIALQSFEAKIVNDALRDGSNVENLVFTHPNLVIPEPDWMSAVDGSRTTSRPWWRFWER
jgi:hypothetical protein